jgi:hypothetical protein
MKRVNTEADTGRKMEEEWKIPPKRAGLACFLIYSLNILTPGKKEGIGLSLSLGLELTSPFNSTGAREALILYCTALKGQDKGV